MTEALAKSVDVRRLLGVLAAHPVLPPIEAVSSDTEALRSVPVPTVAWPTLVNVGR